MVQQQCWNSQIWRTQNWPLQWLFGEFPWMLKLFSEPPESWRFSIEHVTVLLSVGFILRTRQLRGLRKVKKQRQARKKSQQAGGVSEKKFKPQSGSINASRVERNLRQIPRMVGGVWEPLWMMVDSIRCVGVHCDLFPPSSTRTIPSLKDIFPLSYSSACSSFLSFTPSWNETFEMDPGLF